MNTTARSKSSMLLFFVDNTKMFSVSTHEKIIKKNLLCRMTPIDLKNVVNYKHENKIS